MARKIINRKQLRDEVAAADAAEAGAGAAGEKVVKKKPAKRKSRSKVPVDIRMKLFWGVFNQTAKRVALYEYSQKKQADQKAADLSASGKAPHFVQKVKEQVTVEETP